MAVGQEADVARAEQLAWQEVRGELPQDLEYSTQATDKGDRWEVLVLPKGRVRGGGAQVTVGKEPLRVIDVVWLQ